MHILGIETSCDETSVAVVKNGKSILSNVIASSLSEHKKYGGVIPEIASRHQLELINTVVQRALDIAKLKMKNIDGIAVTKSPGLMGSLLVGLSYARALSFAANIPLVEVDHIKAHLYANFLTFNKNQNKPKLPAVGLIVSGGHSSLYYIKNFTRYQLLGQTRDDAAGEAFDKVARILNLGYPGGPIIDKLAKRGHNKTIKFTTAALPGSFDFSFSGVKTAVLYHTQKHINKKNFSVEKVAYAFQNSIISILVKKSIAACLKKKVKHLIVGGGVAANSSLRTQLKNEAQHAGIKTFFPPMTLCVDNAAMVAGYGYHMFLAKS
jgi:N6-L-threonylcarbamoyladenine synthase